MSPRGTSSSLSARTLSPYSRRTASQPKSSRQQFSACGACRMRRVRCDLKDLSASSTHSPCSNCKERGLNCVDEYAEIKAVKLLRRGRRLQQVEAIYGKIKGTDDTVLPSRSSTIPALKCDFFTSKFWTWFCIQRPVLDPNEFSRRYLAHVEGRYTLGSEGLVLAMLLVIWAASFGIDESGMPMDDDLDDSSLLHTTTEKTTISLDSTDVACGASTYVKSSQGDRKHRRQNITSMLQQVLELIDSHGILRRPTIDGARILLLLVPLMEDASYLEKDAMYEAALSHTRLLCNTRSGPWLSSQLPSAAGEDSAALSRMLLYAQIQEGITTTLKGGHQVFRSEDFDILRRMISVPIDTSSMSPLSPSSTSDVAVAGQLATPTLLDKQLAQLTSMPLHLSSVCCKIHEALTGIKAARRAEEHGLVDANGMREIWQDLDQCWHGFVAMRNNSPSDLGPAILESFVDAWLIFIFECHNIILESLKRLTLAAESSEHATHTSTSTGPSRPPSHSSSSSPYLPPCQLYQEARFRCIQLLPRVLRTIRYQLTSASRPNLFTWDTGLIRDGCRSAGLLAAELHGDFLCLDGHQVKPEETEDCITPEDGASLCLSALAEMRWAFSNSEERSEAIRSALERSKENYETRSPTHPPLLSNVYGSTSPHMEHNQCAPYSGKYLHPYVNMPAVRGRRAPLTVNIGLHAARQVESAPNTACSTDGSTGWPTYTPPATASTAPMLSSRGSPDCHSPYQTGHDEAIFYYMPETLDHFTYDMTASHTTTSVVPDTIYQQRNAFYDTHDVHVAVETASDCLGSDFFTPDTCLLPIHEAKGYIDIPTHDTL